MVTRPRNPAIVKAILDAAVHILAAEGYPHFTLRHIARRVGVRLATVQHYFPSKKDILQAAIQHVIGRYDSNMDRQMRMPGGNARSRFQAVAKLHLASCVDKFSGGFFMALWALTAHDDDALELLNDTYRQACQRFASLVAGLAPRVSKREAMTRAVQILTLFEGTTVIARLHYVPSMRALEQRLLETALSIAKRRG